MTSTPTFFAAPEDWRAWLQVHHGAATELSVGFWKTGSGRASITWPQSVDEALAFGWIDGVRHRINDEAYRIRFTPRKAGGIWSQVNIRRFAELAAQGRITPAGQAAYDIGKHRTNLYSYERAASEFEPQELAAFMANASAWAFYQSLPAGYRKLTTHRVLAAKTAETRARRLAFLIDASAIRRKLASATRLEEP